MEGFTSNSKPNLIDNNIMMQLEMRKNMIQNGGAEDPGMCSRMWTKLKQDTSAFFYNNFWILLIIILLGYVLWRRYRWHRLSMKHAEEKERMRLKKKREEKEKKLKMQLYLNRMSQKQNTVKPTPKNEERSTKAYALSNDKRSREFGTYDGSTSYAMC